MDKAIGEIVGIYIQYKKGEDRQAVEEGYFEENKGLRGDIYYGKSKDRQVSIFTIEGWNEIRSKDEEGLCIKRYHENIRVKKLDFNKLNIGSIIGIGKSIHEITEIGKKCFPECNIVKKGDTCPLSKKALFAKVLESGQVKIGDEMTYR